MIANCVTSFWNYVIDNSPYKILVIFQINHENSLFSISKAILITKDTPIQDYIELCQAYWSRQLLSINEY